MSGHAELAHQKHIQRRVECPGNLMCHRHAPTRQCQHHDIVAVPEFLELSGEVLPCLQAICERLSVVDLHGCAPSSCSILFGAIRMPSWHSGCVKFRSEHKNDAGGEHLIWWKGQIS